MKKSRVIALGLILPLVGILLVLATSWCGLGDITTNLEMIRVTEVSLESANLEVHLQVDNPSATGISLDNIAVNLSVANSPLLEMVKKGPIDIDAHSSNHLVFPVAVRFDRLYNLYEQAKDRNELAFSADGIARLQTAIGDPNIYFKFSGTMPISGPSGITVASWRVRELDVDHTRFDLTLKITNVSGKDLVLKKMAYTAGFKHLNLVKRKKEDATLTRPGQVFLVNVPVEVDIAAIRQSVFNVILSEKVAEIKQKNLATIAAGSGDGLTGLSRFSDYEIDSLSTADQAEELEAWLPFLWPSLAAAEEAESPLFTDWNTKMNEPQPFTPDYRKAIFFENKVETLP
ncbi:MAG: LEA type 2 family protein [bacterium]|nr:LEA type 2 family protein [bacterium]